MYHSSRRISANGAQAIRASGCAGMDAYLSYFCEERIGLLDYFSPKIRYNVLPFYDVATKFHHRWKSLKGELCDPIPSKRRSDSGVNLPECQPGEGHASSYAIGLYIAAGWRMMQIASDSPIPFPAELRREYVETVEQIQNLRDIFEIVMLPETKENDTNTSLNQLGMFCSSGLINVRQNAERSDLEKLKGG